MSSDVRKGIAGPDVGIDISGPSLDVGTFLKVLSGQRSEQGVPLRQKLSGGGASRRVLLYLTGHGGDGFLKFHDVQELGGPEFATAVDSSRIKGLYGELLVMLDTCQASTMTEKFAGPGIVSMSSCGRGENSYALHGDPLLGVSTVDRFTASLLSFLAQHSAQEQPEQERKATLSDLFSSFRPQHLRANPVLGTFNSSRSPNEVPYIDFFSGSVRWTAVPNWSGSSLFTNNKTPIEDVRGSVNLGRCKIQNSADRSGHVADYVGRGRAIEITVAVLIFGSTVASALVCAFFW